MNSTTNKVRSGDILTITNTTVNYTKLKPNAENPFKDTYKNVGFQVTIVERCDNRTEDVNGDVNTFSTGLIIMPPQHYHVEVIENPNLYKTGYMLMGAPRIIEPNNHEELIIPLYKFKEAEDIELPFSAVVLVLRQTEYCPMNNIVNRDAERQETQYNPSRSMGRSQMSSPSRGGKNLATPSSKPKGRGGNHMY